MDNTNNLASALRFPDGPDPTLYDPQSPTLSPTDSDVETNLFDFNKVPSNQRQATIHYLAHVALPAGHNEEDGIAPALDQDFVLDDWIRPDASDEEEEGGAAEMLHQAADETGSLAISASTSRGCLHRMECAWQDCKHFTANQSELQSHIKSHCNSQDSSDLKCRWSKCKHKQLKNMDLLLSHVQRTHVTYFCEHPGCSLKTAFRDSSDLRRHQTAVHANRPRFECPFPVCGATMCPRKDKLVEHIRETRHDGDALCIYQHCRGKQIRNRAAFKSPKETAEHYKLYHLDPSSAIGIGAYKCMLGACATVFGDDGFIIMGLAKHVINEHKVSMTYDSLVNYMERSTKISEEKKFTEQTLDTIWSEWVFRAPDKPWRSQYQDCKICLARAVTSAEGSQFS